MEERNVELTESSSSTVVQVQNEQHLPHDIEAQLPKQRPVKVPLHKRHKLEYYTVVIGCAILAFNAGYINGITLQFAGVGVSYISGTSIRIGVHIGLDDWYTYTLGIGLLLAFMFGCAVTGYYMPNDSFKLGRKYGPLFLIGGAFFATAFALSYCYPEEHHYLYFAATGCGVQNAFTTKYCGNVIRTSHLSGSATDMGLVCGRYMKKRNKSELWKLTVFFPMMLFFICGGMSSVPAHKHLGKSALLVNVVLFFFIGVSYSIIVGRDQQIPAWKVYLGLYQKLKTTTKVIRRSFKYSPITTKKIKRSKKNNNHVTEAFQSDSIVRTSGSTEQSSDSLHPENKGSDNNVDNNDHGSCGGVVVRHTMTVTRDGILNSEHDDDEEEEEDQCEEYEDDAHEDASETESPKSKRKGQ